MSDLTMIVDTLRAQESVKAVWLAGSRGRGTSDAYSDIDIWVAIEDSMMLDIASQPLAFVHTMVPTIMHIIAPEIAPRGGAFVGSWVPISEVFVQVDWYLAPASSATRAADTQLLWGDVPITVTSAPPQLEDDLVSKRIQEKLILALQMINNTVKQGRRGNTWRSANSAQHASHLLADAAWLIAHGTEPGYEARLASFLPEPVPTTHAECRRLAASLLDSTERIAARAGVLAEVTAPLAAMGMVIHQWADTQTPG